MLFPCPCLESYKFKTTLKVRLVKAMVFPVVMYGCESWTVKKAERQRIDALELWCWRRLLRVPWTAGRSNQSILKEISSGISLEPHLFRIKLEGFTKHMSGRLLLYWVPGPKGNYAHGLVCVQCRMSSWRRTEKT